jgi:hypothetical protein
MGPICSRIVSAQIKCHNKDKFKEGVSVSMEQQNYAKHRKMDPAYHYLLSLLTLGFFVGALVYLGRSLAKGERLFEGILFTAAGLILILLFIKVRSYALHAQDRAIRAEEQLRHYMLTGKRIDSRLTLKQIVALRFASDDEFAGLCTQAAEASMKPDDIKKAISQWKTDHDRL